MSLSRVVALAGLLASSLFLTSCASYFTRKECEKTNWFQHGESVAMSGKRLTADPFLAQCEKVDAQINHVALSQGFKKGMTDYCRPETVYLTGKKGEFFSAEMCDGENPRLLKEKHEQGVLDYCKRSNGYNAGLQGKPYNNICPDRLESEFMPEFNRGRKVYLESQVAAKETEINDIEREVSDIERRKASVMQQLAYLPTSNSVSREIRVDPVTGTRSEQTSVSEDQNTKMRRDNLQSDADRLEYQVREKREKQKKLRDEIRDLKAELMRL